MPSNTLDTSGDLFDIVIARMHLKNDAALARLLEVAPPVISKIRNGKLPLGASIIIRVHEVTDMPVKEIKTYLPALAD